jgi:hypothetical protein
MCLRGNQGVASGRRRQIWLAEAEQRVEELGALNLELWYRDRSESRAGDWRLGMWLGGGVLAYLA